jgi:3-phosphoinositide dependent protein kinase-1
MSVMSFSSILLPKEGNYKERDGTFVGTPLYVAPEMLESNKAGRYTDLWALGCIIYQLIVGTTPF